MMVASSTCKKLFRLLIPFLVLLKVTSIEPSSMASLGLTWTNRPQGRLDNSMIEPILYRKRDDGLFYACGFYCNLVCNKSFLTVYIGRNNRDDRYVELLQVVWSANRNYPVRLNATLQVTTEGLVLRDDDGRLAWSTNTRGKHVNGLNLTENGNLVLFDGKGEVIWQSFDYPTDSLVPGQRLVSGQKLTASASESNWTEGTYFAEVVENGLFVYMESNYPQAYKVILNNRFRQDATYAQFEYGRLNLGDDSNQILVSRHISGGAEYVRLMPDGDLKVYEWANYRFDEVNVLTDGDQCDYNMVCGANGICSKGKCTCPTHSNNSITFFRPISEQLPNLGCSAVNQLSCNETQYHSFVDIENATYFTFNSDIKGTDVDRCKEECVKNCSCKAVVFRYISDPSEGDCYFASEEFSLINNGSYVPGYSFSTHIKVQILPSARKKKNNFPVILKSTLSGFFVLVFIIGVVIIWKRYNASPAEEDYLDHLPGMPSRFSYGELKTATNNFSTKLGQGGFGSVYEGTLKDGTKVAVKHLDGVGQITKSFLAEVQSIGNIHHVNLVRLVGFAAEKSHRLLVYEYMTNGSLERWIYHKTTTAILDFKSRKAIIQDVAKGLAYLHEECRQKILHLDIKPQNILLDENFNAKLSDFGLSKLIDRDQSQVVTTMRGTPGYLAPEWLSAIITEKVDVYSFGIVVLEILCGRKIFEVSEPEEESRFLLSLFKMKAMEGQLLDIVDKYSKDMQSHGEEVVEMMNIAASCLHNDYSRRPSMSVVVKMLDGMDVGIELDYNSLNSEILSHQEPEKILPKVTPTFASILSGPR